MGNFILLYIAFDFLNDLLQPFENTSLEFTIPVTPFRVLYLYFLSIMKLYNVISSSSYPIYTCTQAGVIHLRSSTSPLLQMVNVQISPSRKEILSQNNCIFPSLFLLANAFVLLLHPVRLVISRQPLYDINASLLLSQKPL